MPHRGTRQEQATLVDRVVEHVEQPAEHPNQRASAQAKDHVADLADGVETEEFAQVVLDHGHHHRAQHRNCPDQHHGDAQRLGHGEELKDQPRQQGDAEQLVERGGQKRHHGHRRPLRRSRNPGVERERPGLGNSAREHQQERRRAEGRASLVERQATHLAHQEGLRVVEPPQEDNPEQKGGVGEAEEHEGLRSHPRRRLAPEVHQKVEHQGHHFPRDEEEEEVVGEHGAHRAGQRPEREGVVAALVAMAPHIRHGETHHHQAEERDEGRREPAQRADPQDHAHVEAADLEPLQRVAAPAQARQATAENEGDDRGRQADERRQAPGPAAHDVAHQAGYRGYRHCAEEDRLLRHLGFPRSLWSRPALAGYILLSNPRRGSSGRGV